MLPNKGLLLQRSMVKNCLTSRQKGNEHVDELFVKSRLHSVENPLSSEFCLQTFSSFSSRSKPFGAADAPTTPSVERPETTPSMPSPVAAFSWHGFSRLAWRVASKVTTLLEETTRRGQTRGHLEKTTPGAVLACCRRLLLEMFGALN